MNSFKKIINKILKKIRRLERRNDIIIQSLEKDYSLAISLKEEIYNFIY
jgi:hypothetical protein